MSILIVNMLSVEVEILLRVLIPLSEECGDFIGETSF